MLHDWTSEDSLIAEAFRLERFRSCFPNLLNPCFLVVQQDNSLAIHATTPDVVDDLIDELDRVAWYSWITVGVTELSLHFAQEELLRCCTREQQPTELVLEEALQSKNLLFEHKEFFDMPSIAPPKPNVSKSLAQPTTEVPSAPLARIKVRSLVSVAEAANRTPEEIEHLCQQNGFMVTEDIDGNAAMLLSDAATLIGELAKNDALARLEGRASAKTVVTTAAAINGKPPAAPEPVRTQAAALAVEPEAPAAATQKVRSRARTIALPPDFQLSSSATTTLRQALAYFAETEGRRNVIVRAITNRTADAKKYMTAILEHAPEADRADLEAKLIKAATRMANKRKAAPATEK